jgi:hypothetical protein
MPNLAAELPAVREGSAKNAGKYGYAVDLLLDRLQDGGRSGAYEALQRETVRGYTNRKSTVRGMNRGFLEQFGALRTALTTKTIPEEISSLLDLPVEKSFTAGNMGIGSSYGLVPFDLLAPSRFIYPAETVFRNMFPRTPAQGNSLQETVVTGISGSQTDTPGIIDVTATELAQGTSFGQWPMNMFPAGAQAVTKLNVPYKFFGITEALSWLSQFAGQGFDDITSLANFILLQEMMLGEEYMLIAGTGAVLPVPPTPTCAVRFIGSTETALGAGTYSVYVTAANYWGSTAVSAPVSVTLGANQVIDVTISPVLGALFYNVWVTLGGIDYLVSPSTGGIRCTLQGPLPVSGSRPVSDTGTGKATRSEGVISVCSGASSNAGVYPPGWSSYTNNTAGVRLDYNLVYTTLDGLWNFPRARKADPEFLVGAGSDIMRLSQDVIGQGNAVNYILNVPTLSPGVAVGAAVSEFQSPITRSNMKVREHPWFPQGTAILMSDQLPHSWSNIKSAWEVHVVQDYFSIAWPTIDATFGYSVFMYGSLVAHAPQYTGLIQGIQVSEKPPYS